MALELLKWHTFSMKSDVWSLGILMFEVLTHCMAELYMAIAPLQELIEHLESREHLYKTAETPQVLHDIALSCWNVNKDDLPTFEQLTEQRASLLYDLTNQMFIEDAEVLQLCDDEAMFDYD